MAGNKKIVLVTSSFPYGGAGANLMRYFSLALAMQNNDVEVIIPTGSYYGKKVDVNQNRSGHIESVKYRHLGFINHPRNYFGKIIDNLSGLFSPFFFLLLKSRKKRPDIIIVYDPKFFALIMHLLTKYLFRKKLVLILPEFYEKPKSKFISLLLIDWYRFYFSIKYLARFADKFIVVSYYLKNYVESRLKSVKRSL